MEDERRVLDRPVWHALAGRQAGLAIGGAGALRFDPACGPLSGADRISSAALAAIAWAGDLWFLEKEPIEPPPGFALVRRAACLQMVARSIAPAGDAHAFEELGAADAAEMLALATLTAPGPFAEATYRLGGFIGIRHEGRLVAMAGERLKPGRFTEVSGVCTHPDHRGRGHAGFLMRVVAERIAARGEVPFLHTYADNAGAIALYQSLGFEAHQRVMLTVLAGA